MPWRHKKLAIPSYDGMVSLLVGNVPCQIPAAQTGGSEKWIFRKIKHFWFIRRSDWKGHQGGLQKAALKYHPDRNPLGAELMKELTLRLIFSWLTLTKLISFKHWWKRTLQLRWRSGKSFEYSSGLTGIVYEVIGNWVWISGEPLLIKKR